MIEIDNKILFRAGVLVCLSLCALGFIKFTYLFIYIYILYIDLGMV